MDGTSFLISCVGSVFGLAYVTYGKKQGKIWFALSGVGLMVYPYFVDSLTASLVAGISLLAAPLLLGRLGL